jgi:hypothetical protein
MSHFFCRHSGEKLLEETADGVCNEYEEKQISALGLDINAI